MLYEQDIIDTRDVISRLAELESDLEIFMDEGEDENIEEKDFEEIYELEVLRELESDLVSESEYKYGMTLIAEDHFEDYCRELVEEIGDLPKDFPSYIEIDWHQTSENLRVDYSEVQINGNTYYYRS
jgi:hypothetical protein